MFSLQGKRAFVTGGAAGIGLAVGRRFVEAGAAVVLADVVDGVETAAEVGASFCLVDVANESSVAEALGFAESKIGSLDVVVNNAGVGDVGPTLEETGQDLVEKLTRINQWGVLYGLKHAPRHMHDGGSIITAGSAAGSGVTTFGHGEYAASKAGAAYLTRTVAIEQAHRGIRANVVCPACVAGTGMMTPDDGGVEATYFSTLTALGRMGRVDEVVNLYAFLASDASTIITGQEIRIDGGMTAGIVGPLNELAAEKAGLE